MKDPAFLLYTKDFQTGTQHLSAAELGVYFRLLMHQHQHGMIPSETERMMRIAGVFDQEEFGKIWEAIEEKFTVLDNHLVNQKLNQVMNQRATAKPKRIAAGTLAGLLSANKRLNTDQRHEIKQAFDIESFMVYSSEEMKQKIKDWFYNLVNHLVNNIANANANEDENNKGGVGEKNSTAEEILKTDEVFLESVFMNNHFDPEKGMFALTQFSLKLEGAGEYFHPAELIRLRARFKKWCNTWSYTEHKEQKNKSVDPQQKTDQADMEQLLYEEYTKMEIETEKS